MTTKENMKIKDFSDTDVQTVQKTLDERWGKDKTELQFADVDVRANDRELSTCPALFWEHKDSRFIIFKISNLTYKAQFDYNGQDQYGTPEVIFDNVLDCLVTILQVHADLEREKSQQEEK